MAAKTPHATWPKKKKDSLLHHIPLVPKGLGHAHNQLRPRGWLAAGPSSWQVELPTVN